MPASTHRSFAGPLPQTDSPTIVDNTTPATTNIGTAFASFVAVCSNSTPSPILPSSTPHRHDHDARHHRRKNLRSEFSTRPIAISQAPANITIPHTTGKPNVEAAAIAEGK